MFKLQYRLMEELDGPEIGGDGGGGEGTDDGGSPDAVSSSPWLRDIDEETGYGILQSAKQFPDHLRGLESRLFGSMGPLKDKLSSLEKSLATRVSFDADRIKKALDTYDGTGSLSESLIPALKEALNVNSLDENSIRPFLEPVQQDLARQMAENIVLSHYSPKQIAEMIPEVTDGRWNPQNQRQKDFIQWYSQQGWDTQQALNEFGPNYIHALRSFENWERDKNQERNQAAGAKSTRLAGGQQPSSQGRRPRTAGPQTPEEAFLAGYNEVD